MDGRVRVRRPRSARRSCVALNSASLSTGLRLAVRRWGRRHAADWLDRILVAVRPNMHDMYVVVHSVSVYPSAAVLIRAANCARAPPTVAITPLTKGSASRNHGRKMVSVSPAAPARQLDRRQGRALAVAASPRQRQTQRCKQASSHNHSIDRRNR